MNRRDFLRAAATTAAGLTIVPRHVLGQGQTPPSERLNLAWVGAGGQGGGLLGDAAFAKENIVALCDVDWGRAAGSFKKFPDAKPFKDYRRLLDKPKDLDAVVVATPDHMHAPIALAAMRAGKHVYVEKPLAHSIEECRVMTRVARETGLVTQMGNMGHGGEGIRLTREFILAGAIGTVREVHCWSDRTRDVLDPGPRPAHRHAARPGQPRLGPLARRRPASALPSDLRAGEMARLVRLRHGRPGRHGGP